MTTITAKFRGSNNNLKNFLVCGVKYATDKTIGQNNATVTFICEESNYEKALSEVMEDISMREADMWNVDVISVA